MDSEIWAIESLWRDTARPLRFFFWDARVLAFMLIWAAHMRLWTFVLAFVGMCFFALIEFLGITPMAALRYAKNFWAGKARPLCSSYAARRRCLC
ncbi:MAG: IcmT/TraK family protein [Desulfovibrio sp.]|nr:IcmT/TraK family protein [Desulfovibrio sp.]